MFGDLTKGERWALHTLLSRGYWSALDAIDWPDVDFVQGLSLIETATETSALLKQLEAACHVMTAPTVSGTPAGRSDSGRVLAAL